jgi:hypothetical protein
MGAFHKAAEDRFENVEFFLYVLSKIFNDIFVTRHFCVTWKWLYTSFKITKPFYGAIPLTIRLSIVLTGTAVKKRIIFYFSIRVFLNLAEQ